MLFWLTGDSTTKITLPDMEGGCAGFPWHTLGLMSLQNNLLYLFANLNHEHAVHVEVDSFNG